MIILNVMQFKTEEAQTQDALTESEQVRNHSTFQHFFLLLFAFSILSAQCKPLWYWEVTPLTMAWPNSAPTSIALWGG